MPVSRQIECVDVSRGNTKECLKQLNAVLKKRRVAETDVISIDSQMDDAGVTMWAYYWRR